MIILVRERIKFSQKTLENKEINKQWTTFSYLIFDMDIFAGIIANWY